MVGGMVFLILLSGAVSAAIFISEGAQMAVYAQVAVIPLLLLGGYVWVNRTVQSAGSSRTEFERRKARLLGEQLSDVWQTAQQINRAYPRCLTATEWESLERIVTEAESAGIAFDGEAGTFEMTKNLGSLEEFNRLEGELERAETDLYEGFRHNSQQDLTAVTNSLKRLSPVVPDSEPPQRTLSSDNQHWQDVADVLDDHYEAATQYIYDVCEQIQQVQQGADGPANPAVEQQLSSARQAADAREFEQAATAVLDARDLIARETSGAFHDRRDALEELIAIASGVSIPPGIASEYEQRLDEYARELETLDDAMGINDIHELEQDVRELLCGVVSDLQSRRDELVETLGTHDIPEGWYDPPDNATTSYLSQLTTTPNIDSFTDEWETAVEELVAVIDELEPKSTVVSGYDRIEPQITETLKKEGVVTGEDLPVGELEEQFLILYYRNHMNRVEYDPGGPQLVSSTGTESYTVSVIVEFDVGGDERELTIRLTGATHTAEETAVTPFATTVSFDEVPYGEYTLEVIPDSQEFGPVTREITVDDDLEIDIELTQRTLREQLCEGLDIDIEHTLSEFSSRLEEQFEAEQYLHSDMSVPIADEYVPCLLVSWAEENGYTVGRDGDDITVFERERVQKELENVIRYNLEDDETKSFAALRNNFLSAPISDTMLTELVEESTEHDAVRIDETGITKVEETQ